MGVIFMKKIYFVLMSLLALTLSAGANYSWIPGPTIVKYALSFWS